MNSLLELMQILAFTAFDLSNQNRLTPVDLIDDIVHHDACLVVFQFARFEVVESPLNRPSAIVFSLWLVSQKKKKTENVGEQGSAASVPGSAG